jgi:hypothetical protein
MTRQQLQHADVLTHSRPDAMSLFQPPAKLGEYRRQLPVPIDVRVIQRGRPTLQCRQVMPRIEQLIARDVTPLVSRHDCVLMNDLNPVDVAFDCHCLKRAVARHAVTDVVEPRELILVDLRFLTHTGVEPMPRQGR